MNLTFDLEVKFKVKCHWWLYWRPHVSILLSFEDIKEFVIFWWPWPLTLRSSSRSKVTYDFSEDPMSLSCLVLKILRNNHVLMLTRGDNSYKENFFYATIVDLNCPNIFQYFIWLKSIRFRRSKGIKGRSKNKMWPWPLTLTSFFSQRVIGPKYKVSWQYYNI